MKNRQGLIQFIKFGLVGVMNTAINYITYMIFVILGFHYLVASIIAFVVSVLNAYYWNSRHVFTTAEGETRVWWMTLIKTFMTYAFTGLILNNLLLWILIDGIHLSQFIPERACVFVNDLIGNAGRTVTAEHLATYIAPLGILVISVPLNFIISKFWTFRTQSADA